MGIQRLAIIAAICGSLLMAAPSRAQEDNVTVVMPDKMSVEMVRNETGGASIRVTSPTVINGCLVIPPLEYKRQYSGMYLDIAFAGYKMNFPEDRSPGCNKGLQYPRVDIPVSLQSLQSNKVEAIRFMLGAQGRMDIYDVDLGENSITLLPRTDNIFKLGKPRLGGIVPTTVVIYPRSTLILTAPSIPQETRADEIRKFAEANNLAPLETELPDFVMPLGRDDRYYYIDKSGEIAEKVQSYNNVNLTNMIYARRPGAYE